MWAKWSQMSISSSYKDGMVSCNQLYYKEQTLEIHKLAWRFRQWAYHCSCHRCVSLLQRKWCMRPLTVTLHFLLPLWTSASSSIKSRALTRRPLKSLLKSHLKFMYNDCCWKCHSHQGMSGAKDKVGDDHWLSRAAWSSTPKTKILFLKLYHFSTLSCL